MQERNKRDAEILGKISTSSDWEKNKGRETQLGFNGIEYRNIKNLTLTEKSSK